MYNLVQFEKESCILQHLMEEIVFNTGSSFYSQQVSFFLTKKIAA
jgi:hypothetical protein